MRVLVPGHLYLLDVLDAPPEASIPRDLLLRFVRRVGPKFPGNIGRPFDGTTSQEVLRALIDRARYVDGQARHYVNPIVIDHMRHAVRLLEHRAASEHRDQVAVGRIAATSAIESVPTCPTCGHVFCSQRH